MAKKERKEPLFRIGVILVEKGVSQKVFAKLVKANLGTVSEWVTHKVYPEMSKLPLIAKVLNVNLQELFIPTAVEEGKSKAEIAMEEYRETKIKK